MWSMGVDIEFADFDVDPTNPESMLMYNIQGSIAQYNKAKILANSKRGRIAKAKKGEFPSSRRLYGYTFKKETVTPEINEEEKSVLIQMKDMLLYEGMSSNERAKHLSKIGIPALLVMHGIKQFVQVNGKKKQIPRPREEWILIKIPQIWNHETKNLILEALKKNTRNFGRKSKDYVLKGKVKCGRCGGTCGSGITSKTKSGIYKYYSCSNKRRKSYINGVKIITCEGKNWRVDIVDEVFWKWFKNEVPLPLKQFENYLLNKNMRNESTSLKSENVRNQLKRLSSEQDKYILLFGKIKISEKQYDDFTQPIVRQISYLENELVKITQIEESIDNSLDIYNVTLNFTRAFRELLETRLNTSEKRILIDYFIDEVIFLTDNNELKVVFK
ncbi:recombinase zinc beta ribbon domain-containing protein [Bacillus sp. BR_10]